MQCSMIQVNEYFSCHLHRRSWQEIPEDIQSAAVNMAEADIKLALNCDILDTGDLLIFCAICEQALFLAVAEYKRQNQSTNQRILKSETVEGVGKREYYIPESANTNTSASDSCYPAAGNLAPRSELFRSRLPGYRDTRFGRG